MQSFPRIYLKEARYEFLKVLRTPAYAIPTLTFPVLFYLFFGVAFGSGQAGPVSMAAYLLATYGAFGVIGTALFGFGVGVAIERGQGWLLLKRASPMPPGAYFLAKIIMSLAFGAVVLLALFTLGGTAGGVDLAPTSWLTLFAVLLAGALPFCAMGLALGYNCAPNAAPAIVNLIYLPMAFASGLWIPLPVLPRFVQSLAPWLPAYHSSQLALKVIGADAGEPVLQHLEYLVAFTVICLVATFIGYRRDEHTA